MLFYFKQQEHSGSAAFTRQPNFDPLRKAMSIPEILQLEPNLPNEAELPAEMVAPAIAIRKRIIAATMQRMAFIDDVFTGKLIISFKEGGVSYIEKVEQFK
jgi:hypothetical protein